ncbi:MAG TPA: hypothetical protein VES20_04660 [Bryobacteraceae bacterium]|nr:hypothetical protein [Bryobacteraceae bacterium]
MHRRSALAILICSSVVSAQKQKGPEVEILDATAKVDDSRVNVDCRIRNVSGKPIRKVAVILEVLDIGNNVLTKQQGHIEAPVLEPGDDSLFQAQFAYHARNHAWRVSFEDASGRELRVENAGPFPIE